MYVGAKNSLRIFKTFLGIGLVSFGGPTAHIAVFKRELVDKRSWLNHDEYLSLISLCQILPGPTSSQVGFSIGFVRGGWLGAFMAWLGFTLPAFCIMAALGLGLLSIQGDFVEGLSLGLSAVVVPIVAQAVLSMGINFCNDLKTRVIAVLSFALIIFFPIATIQLLAIIFSAILGLIFITDKKKYRSSLITNIKPSYFNFVALGVFFFLLPMTFFSFDNFLISVFSGFYRAGSLVFGGGHVVFPFLKNFFVDSEFITLGEFLTGYGFAQAIPGPLFSMAGYIGVLLSQDTDPLYRILISLFSLISIFLPTFLFLPACLQIWPRFHRHNGIFKIIAGINAGVVGILLANFVNPILLNSLDSTGSVFLLAIASLLVFSDRVPTWAIVLISGLLGLILSIIELI